MPPSAKVYSQADNADDGYDTDFVPVQNHQRFPTKYTDDDDHYTLSGRSQHYTDSEPKQRLTGRSRTNSSAKRSRKTSSSTARELVRALLNEKLDAEATSDAQLAHAYDVLRAESRRAADAERIALESAERLKGLALARVAAQQDAARAQAELRAYKLQFDNAQRQLEDANALAAASDADRVRAERAMGRMKRTVERFRESELARRAREQGWREGRQEALRSVGVQMRSGLRDLIVEDEDDDVLRTPTSNVPLPVPPPASVPILSRRIATPTLRQSTRTPVLTQPEWQGPPVPEVIRQQMTPPRQRVQTPSWQLPVPPPAPIPVLPRHSGTPGPRQGASAYDDDVEAFREPRERSAVPDHIIIRSPVPVYASSQSPPLSQPVYPSRPPSSQATRPTHITYPQQHSQAQHRHARHHTMDDPAALASASASRIYSQYATSSESSSSEPVRPSSRVTQHRHGLPQQETIVPRPAPGSNQRFTPPARPPSASGSIPASAAAFARQRQRRPSVSSSSTTSSSRTETTFPAPSRVAQLRRQPLGNRSWSAESGSSVPGIIIEPPSRPESVDTVATGVTLPSHLTPFGQPRPELAEDAPSPSWGAQPQIQPRRQPQRPLSRTGFVYGPPSPTAGVRPPMGFGTGGGVPGTPGGGGRMSFASPPSPNMSPTINFGAPPPVVPSMPSMQHSTQSRPRHMSTNDTVPVHPGGAADYFAGDHHSRHDHRHGNGHQHGHRREPAGMGASLETLGMVDTNAFHDPDTDPSLEDEDEFRREGAGTPRAGSGAHGYDERRTAFDERRGTVAGASESGNWDQRSATSAPGFAPPRPPSRSSTAALEEFRFDSPRRVPLPASTSASAYASRSASVAPGGSGSGAGSKGARSRKTSLLSGGIGSRKADGGGSRPASRTAFGNTPFVRSSGLYDD